MKARKKKELFRKKVRETKEIIKSAPSFTIRDEKNIFDYEADVREAKEALAWVSTI
nr:MAG TPA: hypothetical protein [Caudoviricetes sp.]